METVITKHKILSDISDYRFSLQNVYNYQFRSLFNIGNTTPKNRSEGTKIFQLQFKILRVIWQLFNVWREIIVDPYSWAVGSPSISCQVRCRLMKVCMLSSFNVMNLWIYCKVVFIFYNKHHTGKYVLRHQRYYFQFPKQISTWDLLPTAHHNSILFCILYIFLLWDEVPQNGRPQFIIELKLE